MHDVKPGDAVKHNGYPIGTLKEVRNNIANGEKYGMVQLYGYPESDPQSIPMIELTMDAPQKAAA